MNEVREQIKWVTKHRPSTGEFVCPRCGDRMVRYRVDERSVQAACGRANCLRLSYRLKSRVRLSHCQMELLRAMRAGAKVRYEQTWWMLGVQSTKINFRCDGIDKWGGWPKRTTLEILEKRYGLVTKMPGPERDEQIAYTLNRRRCTELNIWTSKPR